MTATATTVLITGCSSGIGRAAALEFHRRGFVVYATARRLQTLSELEAQGIRTAQLDVDDEASIVALQQHLDAEDVSVDVLINNAGYGAMGPLLEMSGQQLRQQFDTNVLAVMAMTRALAPGMLRRGGGRIVNIGSVSGVLVTPFAGAYCASKAAVHALSDALRMELAPFGIHVITIQPGAIQSDFGATASRGVAARDASGSVYAPIEDAIAARANASQQRSTTTESFARQLADAVLAPSPAATVRIGSGSFALPFLQRWLPTVFIDRMLSRRFKLDQLQRKR